MKTLTIGILAHVDAGKTTLSEAMLYRAGMLRAMGRVDHGDAFLDPLHFTERTPLQLPQRSPRWWRK